MSFTEIMGRSGADSEKIQNILASWSGFQLINIPVLYERIYRKICLQNLFSERQLREKGHIEKNILKNLNKYLTVTWWLNGRLPTRNCLYSIIGLPEDSGSGGQEWIPPQFCLKKKVFTTGSESNFEEQRIWLTKFLQSYKKTNLFENSQAQEATSRENSRSERVAIKNGNEGKDNEKDNENLMADQLVGYPNEPNDGNNEEKLREIPLRRSSAEEINLRVEAPSSDRLKIDDPQHEQQNDIELSASSLKRKKIYPCNMCDKTYGQRGHLKQHFNSAHLNIRYRCHICEQSFTFPFNRNHHVRSVHQRISFHCVQCNRSFVDKRNLKKHNERLHQTDS